MTRRIFHAGFAIVASILLGACWSHSFPLDSGFIRPTPEDCVRDRRDICNSDRIVQVFADMNGTLFPDGWRSHPRLQRLAHSVLAATHDDPEALRFVEDSEEAQLRAIAALSDGPGPGRIFILVHGYNNTVAEADAAYDYLIDHRLDLRPEDRVLRFYWDGHDGSGIGDLRVWFWASGDSQLVGSRALRSILNRLRGGEQVYLIGHSRGTSVILSALSDPVYDPDFLEAIGRNAARWRYPRLLARDLLVEDNKQIEILVAAPAVDRIDFCDSRAQALARNGRWTCPDEYLRPLGDQVHRFRYTVNSRDFVLNKVFGLGNAFNPTRLGSRRVVGELLAAARYPQMRAYPMPRAFKHAFTWYIRQPAYCQMLYDAGILRANAPDCPAALARMAEAG